MFENIFRLLSESVIATHEQARRIHDQLVIMLLGLLVVIGVMWGLNVTGYKFINAFIFAFGGLFIIVQATRPLAIGFAGAVGAGAERLADRDASQGVLKGLSVYYRVVLGALFGFWVLAGLLATWSFEESPRSFFTIMGMIMMVTVTMATFKMTTGKLSAKIIITYSVVVMLIAFWQTLTPGQKAWFPQIASGTGTGQTTALFSSPPKSVEHPVPLSWKPVGDKVTIEHARPNDEFVISLENANVDQTGGKVFGTCAKVVRPELPPEMVVSFENVLGSGTNVNVTKITEKSQVALFAYMKQQGYEGVNMTIEFTKTLKERGARICAND